MIHIITPCSRPWNVEHMVDSVPTQCHWVIVYDNKVLDYPDTVPAGHVGNITVLHSPYTGHSGNPNRNYALDSIIIKDDDWVYILDDDNIIHPQWYTTVLPHLQEDTNMLLWGQLWSNGEVRLHPAIVPGVGNVDTACYMVRGSIMRTLRFQNEYTADGILAREVLIYGKQKVLNEYIAYYNYLRS